MDEPSNRKNPGEKDRAVQTCGGMETPMMECPQCSAILNPAHHGDLVFDGRVWCDRCHEYGRELIRPREFREIQAWSLMICRELGFAPVLLEENAAPAVSRPGAPVLMAEADHWRRSIRFYAPGCRLATLCHELAHIYTGQDHSRDWAMMFARLVAWVKTRLGEDHGPQGFTARLSIYAGVSQRVYESREPPATGPGAQETGHEPGTTET